MIKDIELDGFLDEMSQIDKFSSKNAFKSIEGRMYQFEQPVVRKIIYIGITALTGVAAMLVFWFSVFNTITNNSSEPLLFQLPDGSTVVLNKGAKLEYGNNFNKNRTLELTGEAYFNVAKNESNPFVINVGTSKVKVLGTSFNVRHNKKSDDVEVYVKSGLVLLENSNNESIKLSASEYGFSNRSVVYTENINDKNYMAWQSRKLVFINDDLDYVVKTIEKVYHCNINLHDSSISSLRISTTFFNLSEQDIIESIGLTLNLKHEKTDDGYVFSMK